MTDEQKAWALAWGRFGEDYLLRQTAEECAELTQAALKLVRVKRGESPMLLEDARNNLVEELADVRVMLAVIEEGLASRERVAYAETYNAKLHRMIERLLSD